MTQDALTAQAEIARLKFQWARYRRAEFGRPSEKLARDTEQLELALETPETDQAERLATALPAITAAVETAAEAQKPVRCLLPEHLPREDLRHPAPCTCPSCGGALRKISDEVTETLDTCRAGSKFSVTSRKAVVPGLRHIDREQSAAAFAGCGFVTPMGASLRRAIAGAPGFHLDSHAIHPVHRSGCVT
jgi:Transposase C of IS166 homeodomain